MTTSDHFTPVADQYAAFRPTYPEALFDWLAGIAPQRNAAWDCGAGSGQATAPLSARFASVIATDISSAQLASAPPHPNVEYRVARAESSGLADRSLDLVTVAQAMHWFDLPQFYAEVKRVLRADGVIAVWGYNRMLVGNEELQQALDRFYEETIGAYWPPERVHVETGYRDLPFPFARIEAPHFALYQDWTLEHLLGYLRSWSAVARYRAAHGHDPVSRLAEEIAPLWGDAAVRRITWPLFLHAGRVD